MKNREKYKDELIETIKKDGEICGFMKKHNDVLQPLDLNDVLRPLGLDEKDFCDEIDCYVCATMLQLWLDEEYVEPEVDWRNVPVDTLVRVRDSKDEEWTLMYFKGIDEKSPSYKFQVWIDGATSKTANGGNYVRWKYCELAGDLEEK